MKRKLIPMKILGKTLKNNNNNNIHSNIYISIIISCALIRNMNFVSVHLILKYIKYLLSLKLTIYIYYIVMVCHSQTKVCHIIGENICIKTRSFDNINCKYEHVMHRYLKSCPLALHEWETQGFSCAYFKFSLDLIKNGI